MHDLEPLMDQYKFFTKLQPILAFFAIEGKKVGFEGPKAGNA